MLTPVAGEGARATWTTQSRHGNGYFQNDCSSRERRYHRQLLVVRRHARRPLLPRLRQSATALAGELLLVLRIAAQTQPGRGPPGAGLLRTEPEAASRSQRPRR